LYLLSILKNLDKMWSLRLLIVKGQWDAKTDILKKKIIQIKLEIMSSKLLYFLNLIKPILIGANNSFDLNLIDHF